MPGIRLLIVEDESDIAKLLGKYLSDEGYVVTYAASIEAMRECFESNPPDMVMLDVGLPDGDGWDALRWVRKHSDLPVLMLTGRNDPVDRIVGLELGADDYVGKPFVLREVAARLRAISRRRTAPESGNPPGNKPASPGAVRISGLELDLQSQALRDEAGTPIKLTYAEYRILILLANAAGQVVTREKLMQEVAGRDWDPNDRSIDVHVSNLRRKLDAGAKQLAMIRAVRGSGYMLITADE